MYAHVNNVVHTMRGVFKPIFGVKSKWIFFKNYTNTWQALNPFHIFFLLLLTKVSLNQNIVAIVNKIERGNNMMAKHTTIIHIIITSTWCSHSTFNGNNLSVYKIKACVTHPLTRMFFQNTL